MISILIAVVLCVAIGWSLKARRKSTSKKHLYSVPKKNLLGKKHTRELFYISVEAGDVVVVRGRLPAGLLVSFRDILSDSDMSGSIVALREGKELRLVCAGNFRKGLVQRLRNTFFLYRCVLEER